MAKRESCVMILVKMIIMISLLVAAILVGVYYVRDRLNEYFNRGESVPVPDFRGKHLVQVFREKPSELIIETKDEKYDPRFPKDHVIAQIPEPGTKVKPNKKVLLTISMGSKQVGVPDLVEKHIRESSVAIVNAQLKEGTRAYIPSMKVARDRIIGQYPAPFSNQDITGGIDLLISLGQVPPKGPLPNLIGKNQIDAKTILANLDLKLGKVTSKKDPNHPKDQVLLTRPAPFEMITKDTPIDLLISAGNDWGNAGPDELRHFEFSEGAGSTNPPTAGTANPPSMTTAPPKISIGDDEDDNSNSPKTNSAVSATKPDQEDSTEVPSDESEQEDLPVDTLAKEKSEISFTVPDGYMAKEVKFIMQTPDGRREIYSATHKPLDIVHVAVAKSPQTKIQIYLNDVLVEERPIQ